MKGGSILVQTLRNGHKDVWQVDSVLLGGLGEIGIVELTCLNHKNTIDGLERDVAAPSNMVYALIGSGDVEVYDKVQYQYGIYDERDNVSDSRPCN